MMFGLGLLIFGFLCQHSADFRKIKDIKAPVLTMNMVYYTFLNFLGVVCVCIGFGKPYSVAYAAIFASIALLVCAVKYSGLYEWTERFAWLFASLVVVIEYFYNGIRHGKEKENIE